MRRAPRRGVALLLALLANGLGHAYLGYWRRAVLWMVLPQFVGLAFVFLVIHFQLRALYGWVVPFVFFSWVVTRSIAVWDIRSLPERARGRSGIGALLLFGLGILAFTLVMSAFEGSTLGSYMTMPSRSMQPTLLKQEFVMVYPTAYRSRAPRRGELVALGSPGHWRIKRMIGLPGDRIEVNDGALFINGWEARRCELGLVRLGAKMTGTLYLEFLGDSSYLTFWNREGDTGSRVWTAAAGEAVLLNDARNDREELYASDDSGVRLELLEGRPAFLFLGLTLDENFDWSRYGSALDAPQLPSELKALDARFHECLAMRPPRTETEPSRLR